MTQTERVAIVGMGGVFPGSLSRDQYWENLLHARDVSSEPPPDRWVLPANVAYDAVPGKIDRVYSRRGYFLPSVTADPSGLAVDAATLAGLDQLFHISLIAAASAINDLPTFPQDRKRIGVILGSIALPTDASSTWAAHVLHERGLFPKTKACISVHPLNRFVTGLPALLIAQAYGFGGTCFTLDAACASSLYSIALACDELRARRADVMLAGGVSRPDALYTQMGFSQLRALSTSGRCSPFDARGDGLVVGEGGGIFILKRLADAVAHGDRIYATIAGIGLSNDVEGNLLAPASEGQLRAMEQAYRQAGWTPNDVDFIECHATGTPVGDAVEFESLCRLWQGSAGSCVLSSVKSTVGHLLTGAGAAGLMKLLLAMQHETLLPTANFDTPSPRLRYRESRFRILQRAEPWSRRAPGRPRRAAISGFGFGGINAHILLEEWLPETHSIPVSVATPQSPPSVAIVGIAARIGDAESVAAFQEQYFKDRPREANSESMHVDGDPHIPELAFPLGKYAIPPNEVEELLPQQLLLLEVANAALRDRSSSGSPPPERQGGYIGVQLDLNTTNYHLRWSVLQSQGDLPEQLADTLPPLTPARTMGGLASIAASRLARAFRLAGPCFTVSSGETSALPAIRSAVDALQNFQIDQALVGAVDFGSDQRAEAALQSLIGSAASHGVDGCVMLVLKRQVDAERDGDHIYAIIDSIVGGVRLPQITPGSYTHGLTTTASQNALVLGDQSDSVVLDSATLLGCRDILLAALALDQQLLPRRGKQPPQFWLHDQENGPRRAQIRVNGIEGSWGALILRESTARSDVSQARCLPLPAETLIVFQGQTSSELRQRAEVALQELRAHPQAPLSEFASDQRWITIGGLKSTYRVAIVPRDGDDLACMLDVIIRWSMQDFSETARPEELRSPRFRDRVFASVGVGLSYRALAFVYPGSGNHFADMGRSLGVQFPEILRQQQAENRLLRSQYAPDVYWNGEAECPSDPQTHLFAQVSIGTLISDLLARFGVKPDYVLGYSLGESAGLFGTRIWTDRDGMLRRMRRSTLFVSDLAPPYNAARKQWNYQPDQLLEWMTCVVSASSEEVQRAIGNIKHVYVLIINGPDECVLGGERGRVAEVLAKLNHPYWELEGVTTAHCEVAIPVADAYRALHHLPVTPRDSVRFYSGAWGHEYAVTSDSAADSILAGVLRTIDFPRVVRQAYADGARGFIEIGPGNSCTRLIRGILADRPHWAKAVCPPSQDSFSLLLRILAQLFVDGHALDLSPLRRSRPLSIDSQPQRTLRISVGLRLKPQKDRPMPRNAVSDVTPRSLTSVFNAHVGKVLLAEMARQQEMMAAQESFLRLTSTVQESMQWLLGLQDQRLRQMLEAGEGMHLALSYGMTSSDVDLLAPPASQPPRSLNFEQCMEFAAGSIAKVLGPLYAPIDAYPTRVRLPTGPLMLVDRILEIEGEANSMGSGRVLTEHTVHADRWYLDAGRIPTCIAVEAGQADLFLSGFLGIDFRTRGLAVYRLLDAVVTFHRSLPAVGERIKYDISIDHFFQQGDTYLFRFRFESTVDGQPLLSMTDGCAGFFTKEELQAGKGIIHTELDRRPIPGKLPTDWVPLVTMRKETFDSAQIEALRQGKLVEAFGETFANLPLREPMRLPGGMLRLVDRVVELDPTGGRFGIGMIRAEADIHPDDWFLTCHFVDDMVMPGTLMYECCLHTLRIFLMRMGWIGEASEVHCEPKPGISSRLKCRGQVIASTRVAAYEVSLKEIGYDPEPFVICDALMFADGKPIVEISNMSMRLAGLTRAKVEALWRKQSLPVPKGQRKPLYNTDRITAFAIGKPSEAFGEPYRIFDDQRVIARLPGPPFQFLDRIMHVQGEPWKMVPGAEVEAEYDVPPEAWYFAANRQPVMPFSVLLEIALQPCGWLAAYVGSALTSPIDLSFRNLGGKATQLMTVGPAIGTLTSRVKLTGVSHSGGMIIQHYQFAVWAGSREVYRGTTYFGFFSKDALANQIGLRDIRMYELSTGDVPVVRNQQVPQNLPFPDSMFRMVDTINWYVPEGGPKGLGAIEGQIRVDPAFWFFRAHFFQDPVWPGSLGLESFLQLLKYIAWQRWGTPSAAWQTVGIHKPHAWTYRGQVIPTDRWVRVQAFITERDDRSRTLRADGLLEVDGRIIYQMTDFTLES